MFLLAQLVDYIGRMRDLGWEGYFNARDLGGLPTPLSPTGLTLFHRVARGPRREMLTDNGWTHAKEWGLSSVVDLRCEHEVGSRVGDPQVADNSLSSLVLTNAPTEDQDDPEFREVCFPILDTPEYWSHNWRILPHLVRDALATIARAYPGVLVHCSAGRDRTGMVSALLLGNAGVPPNVVADDYAQSVREMARIELNGQMSDRQASWSTAQRESWIDRMLPVVRETAANTQTALDTIGLSHSNRIRLRELLTSE
jgi:protein-tyrosine phosphatase